MRDNNEKRVKQVKRGFSVWTNPPGRSPTGMRKLTYKPKWDDPSLAKPKKAAKKKPTRRKKATRVTSTPRAAQPKKRLPKMKKRGWWFW